MVSATNASSNSASLPVHTPKEILSANRRQSQTKKTKAFWTGQSWRVLKSGYAAGGPEQGSLRCLADVTYRGLFSSATQATVYITINYKSRSQIFYFSCVYSN